MTSAQNKTKKQGPVDVEALKRILRESAGEEADLDGDILDAEFGDLGYDSIALLETVAAIAREYGIQLDDEVAVEATTPRRLLALVNSER